MDFKGFHLKTEFIKKRVFNAILGNENGVGKY